MTQTMWVPIPPMTNRLQLADLLNERGLLGEAVEVGSYRGGFSVPFRQRWNGEKLTCVDRFLTQDGRNIMDAAQVLKQNMDATLRPWSLVTLPSVDASKLFADNSLDMVYLDASHDYDSLYEDTRAWYRKVRPGGIFAGHDYIDGHQDGPGQPIQRLHNPDMFALSRMVYGVRSAVQHFARDFGLEVHEIPEGAYPSWVIQKPLSEKSSR